MKIGFHKNLTLVTLFSVLIPSTFLTWYLKQWLKNWIFWLIIVLFHLSQYFSYKPQRNSLDFVVQSWPIQPLQLVLFINTEGQNMACLCRWVHVYFWQYCKMIHWFPILLWPSQKEIHYFDISRFFVFLIVSQHFPLQSIFWVNQPTTPLISTISIMNSLSELLSLMKIIFILTNKFFNLRNTIPQMCIFLFVLFKLISIVSSFQLL